MISIDSLQVAYGDKEVLNINQPIRFKSGEKIGIIGSNGAGKSTLIKAILGLIPYKGHIERDIRHSQMAVHMQFNNYSTSVKTSDIIQMVANSKIEEDPKLQELIDFFDFSKLLNKTFKQLSGGEKQKLTLILVMWQDAPLTIFDEVTTGLDFVTRQMLMDKIVDYYHDKTTTVLLVSHYYEELENICDQLLYLHQGDVLFYGNKKDLFQTYCTPSVILMDDNETTQQLVGPKDRITSMPNKLAAGINDKNQEKRLVEALIDADQAFERVNDSIELTVLNALEKEDYHE